MIDTAALIRFLWDIGLEPHQIAQICTVLETDCIEDEDLFEPILSSQSEWIH